MIATSFLVCLPVYENEAQEVSFYADWIFEFREP